MENTADLTTMTPAEIDALLAEISYRAARLEGQRLNYLSSARKAREGSRYSRPDVARAEKLEGLAEKLEPQIAEAEAEMAPYDAEFTRRGGWTRAFLVKSNNGHVHRSMACSTCFPTTSYAWMTDFSGMDEAEIVEAAGERACTVCYPSAPVEVLNKPTRMFTPDEVAAQAARAEREAKKATKEALKVYHAETGEELFKTERGATNFIASELDSALWYGPSHPSFVSWMTNVDITVAALAAKRGVEFDALRAELVAKAEKKAKCTLGRSKVSY